MIISKKHKKLLAELEHLRDVYGRGKKRSRLKVIPNLREGLDKEGLSSCSNVIAMVGDRTYKKKLGEGSKSFPVGHSHKQGLELITPGSIKRGELQYYGGKKS